MLSWVESKKNAQSNEKEGPQSFDRSPPASPGR